jgi:hypothetical protein
MDLKYAAHLQVPSHGTNPIWGLSTTQRQWIQVHVSNISYSLRLRADILRIL